MTIAVAVFLMTRAMAWQHCVNLDAFVKFGASLLIARVHLVAASRQARIPLFDRMMVMSVDALLDARPARVAHVRAVGEDTLHKSSCGVRKALPHAARNASLAMALAAAARLARAYATQDAKLFVHNGLLRWGQTGSHGALGAQYGEASDIARFLRTVTAVLVDAAPMGGRDRVEASACGHALAPLRLALQHRRAAGEQASVLFRRIGVLIAAMRTFLQRIAAFTVLAKCAVEHGVKSVGKARGKASAHAMLAVDCNGGSARLRLAELVEVIHLRYGGQALLVRKAVDRRCRRSTFINGRFRVSDCEKSEEKGEELHFRD